MTFHIKPLAQALCIAAAVCTFPFAAQAQSVSTEENAQERINFSGKLRMLSQRIPSAACHLTRGIDPEGAVALLNGATVEFEKILAALEFGGDEDLNIINAETQTRTLRRIENLREKWMPFKVAAQSIIDGTSTDADIDYILNENIDVLRAAQALVEVLVKAYANPNAATHSSLMLIDISGRQRMLTQKMSKESCMIGTAFETETTVDDLSGTMGIFEASLEALRFGMPQVGIAPPPNDQISDGLNVVADDWSRVKPYITDVIAGDSLDVEEDTIKFQGLNVTMANMNRVVGMYTAASG